MENKIRTYKELEQALVVLKEKQKLQESSIRSSAKSLKDILSPGNLMGSIAQKIFEKVSVSWFEKFTGKENSVLDKILGFFKGKKQDPSSKAG